VQGIELADRDSTARETGWNFTHRIEMQHDLNSNLLRLGGLARAARRLAEPAAGKHSSNRTKTKPMDVQKRLAKANSGRQPPERQPVQRATVCDLASFLASATVATTYTTAAKAERE
jgi:hypothetical protein